jgi:branched-chain amino acid transport system ATP-binding protein
MTAPVLRAQNVTMQFGGLTALKDVSLDLAQGQIIGLIGPNGAGKTTFFNCLTGLYTPTRGQVLMNGKQLPNDPAHVTIAGVARTFQNIRLFPNMTSVENVMVGRHARMKQGPIATIFRGPTFRKGEAGALKRSRELLDFAGIGRSADELARNLPYGDQRRLEIARALATEPKLLCLDEPAAGFNPAEKEQLNQLIRKIRDMGYTVLLIEHDMRLVMGVTDRIVVLEFGKKIAEGTPGEIRDNPKVIAAYLGESADAA